MALRSEEAFALAALPSRASTPLSQYRDWAKSAEKVKFEALRPPKWTKPKGKTLDELLADRDSTQKEQERRDWMRRTLHRLKAKGYTDAACRELVATHLPRGHGPKDRHGFARLDSKAVKAERAAYLARIARSTKKCQKFLEDMRTSRGELTRSVKDLWSITEKSVVQRFEEERKRLVAMDELMAAVSPEREFGIASVPSMISHSDTVNRRWATGSSSREDYHHHRKNAVMAVDEAMESAKAKLKVLALANQIPLEEAEKIQRLFRRYDTDDSGSIDKDEFLKLFAAQTTNDEEPMSESEIRDRWSSFIRFTVFYEGAGPAEPKSVEFSQFLVWYWKTQSGDPHLPGVGTAGSSKGKARCSTLPEKGIK